MSAVFDERTGGLLQDGEHDQGAYGSQRVDNDPHTPLAEQALGRVCSFCTTSLNFQKGWFVRFRELQTTVAIPTRWIRMMPIRDLSVTAAVRNVALWTHFTGVDPESNDPGTRRSAGTVVGSIDSRGSFGDAVPMPRDWMIRFNTSF